MTDEHKKLSEDLIISIKDYLENKKKRHYAHVIVAPYGSGKSTLLDYLAYYTWKELKRPAIIANMNRILEYINNKYKKETKGKLPEDKLPDILEEFFKDSLIMLKNIILHENNVPLPLRSIIPLNDIISIIDTFLQKNIRGLLLIDEVEEALKQLKNTINYVTSPFRGLFDAIYNTTSKIYVVIAFGPQSVLMEDILGLSSGWRNVVKSIPLSSPSMIFNELQRLLPNEEKKILRLLSNTLWWISKGGRPGWVYNFIEQSFPRKVIHCLKNFNEKKELIYDDELLKALKKEVVKGIPCFSEYDYMNILNFLPSDSYIERNLFKVLLVLIGPLSENDIRSLGINYDRCIKLNPKIFVVGDKLIPYDAFITAVRRDLEKVAKSRKALDYRDGKIIERAINLLALVFSAWSAFVNKIPMILDERDAWQELKDIAADLSREMYDTETARLIENFEIRWLKIPKEAYTPDGIVYVAMHPRIIENIYPPIFSIPLIGKARLDGIDEVYPFLRDQDLEYLSELAQQLFGILAHILSNQKNQVKDVAEKYLLVPIIDGSNLNKIKEYIFNSKLNGKHPILIPLSPSGEKLKKTIDLLKKELKSFDELQITTILERISPRMSIFVLGILYDIAHQGKNEILYTESEEGLARIERRILESYSRQLLLILYEAIMETKRAISLQELLPDYVLELCKKLDEQAHSKLGSKRAEDLWCVLASQKTIEIYEKIIECLNEINHLTSDLVEIIYPDEREIIKGLLVKKGALDYVRDAKSLFEKLSKCLRDNNTFNMLKLILEDVLNQEKYIDSLFNRIQHSLKEIFKEIEYKSVWYALTSYLTHMLADQCSNPYIKGLNGKDLQFEKSKLKIKLGKLKDKLNINKLKELANLMENYHLPQFIEMLRERLEKFEKVLNKLKSLIEDLKPTNIYEKWTYTVAFIKKEAERSFMENITTILENLDSKLLGSYASYLTQISDIFTKTIPDLKSRIYNISESGEPVLNEDLKTILKRNSNLKSLRDQLQNYITQLQGALNDLGRYPIKHDFKKLLTLLDEINEMMMV